MKYLQNLLSTCDFCQNRHKNKCLFCFNEYERVDDTPACRLKKQILQASGMLFFY
jgi:hypothetical protein